MRRASCSNRIHNRKQSEIKEKKFPIESKIFPNNVMIFPNGGNIMTDPIYISSKETAELLHISTRRAVGLCHDGKLAGAFQQGRSWKIPRESVLAYRKETNPAIAGELKQILPCPVGTTSFVDIVQHNYYVDKTLLIRDLLDDHAAVTLFTRPEDSEKLWLWTC